MSLFLLKSFVQQALLPFDSGACVTASGETLGLKYENLADIGTLSVATSTAIKYFSPNMGDVIMLNDPYSGGTTLSMLTLVTPLILKPDPLYLAIRVGFRSRLVLPKTLDEEGLRIPPTPLVQNRRINSMVMEAISAHPLCPQDLTIKIDSSLANIWQKVDAFQALQQQCPQLSSKQLWNLHLQDSRELMKSALNELSYGDFKLETKVGANEHVRLHLSLSSNGAQFDFAGTSASKKICLTDGATLGACFGGLAAFMQKSIPVDSGSFSLLQILTPVGSLLNAQFPSPTFRGMTEGCPQIAGLVAHAFSQIVRRSSPSLATQAPVQISLSFANGQHFFDAVASGTGASANQEGEDAVAMWTRNNLKNSVQEIESRFPIRIDSIQIRKGSGGKGQFKGGNGMIKTYTVLQDAQLRWLLPSLRLTAASGTFNGQIPEIQIKGANDKNENLILEEGEISLKAGDQLCVHSAGGSGVGAPT